MATSPQRKKKAKPRGYNPRRRSPARRAKAAEVVEGLAAAYPEAHCALDHRNAYELLVATILSAQCTDERVNMVTPDLFDRWPTPAALARADQGEVEEVIHSTGFFRNKAKNIVGMAQRVTTVYGGEVPQAMDDLLTLPGVARKTANVVRGEIWGLSEGIVVDTHVTRIATLLGWTRSKSAEHIEKDLCALHPEEVWIALSHLLIWQGRAVCIARRPRCGDCPVRDLCPSAKG